MESIKRQIRTKLWGTLERISTVFSSVFSGTTDLITVSFTVDVLCFKEYKLKTEINEGLLIHISTNLYMDSL